MFLALPQGKFEIHKEYTNLVLLVAGGRSPSAAWLQALPHNIPVYAADKGVDYCHGAGISVDRLYGDRDSSDPSKWEAMAGRAEVKVFPIAKDATDLDLLLDSLEPHTLVIATGIWGGRADHLYANILSLLKWQTENMGQVVMADQEEIMFLLEEKSKVSFKANIIPEAVSLLAFKEKTEVSIKGVRWPLDHYVFGTKTPGYTVSNTLVDNTCLAETFTGQVGLYFHYKQVE